MLECTKKRTLLRKAALTAAAFLFLFLLFSLPAKISSPAYADGTKSVTITAEAKLQHYGEAEEVLTYELCGDPLTAEELAALDIRLERAEGGEIGVYPISIHYNPIDGIHVNTILGSYTIEKGYFNTENLVFESATYRYDSSLHSVLLKGDLPRGIEVDYYNNEQIDAGVFEAYAYLSCPSDIYYIVGDTVFFAVLTIEKAKLEIGALCLSNATYVYDGTGKGIFLTGELPFGVSVRYIGNTAVNAGTYSASAQLLYDEKNYDLTADGKILASNLFFAILTIEKSKPVLMLPKTEYQKIHDGVPLRLPVIVEGGKEKDMLFTVNGGQSTNWFSTVGEYTVSITTAASANYAAADPITVTVSIRQASVSVAAGDLTARLLSDSGFCLGSAVVFRAVPSFLEETLDFQEKFLQEKIVGAYTLALVRNGEAVEAESDVIVSLGGIPHGKNRKIYVSCGASFTEIPFLYNGAGEITLTLSAYGIIVVTEETYTLYYLIAGLVLFLILSTLVGALTVRARKQFTVSFEPMGGEFLSPIRGRRNLVFELPVPKRTGMKFAGWSLDKNCSSVIDPAPLYRIGNQNVTLYAAWDIAKREPKPPSDRINIL